MEYEKIAKQAKESKKKNQKKHIQTQRHMCLSQESHKTQKWKPHYIHKEPIR